MKIVVIGGTGLIGSKVVQKLKAKGHEAIAAAPNTGVNTITGEGLIEALRGAQVVVDVANSPSFEDQAAMDFFQTAGKNLAQAEIANGREASRRAVRGRHRAAAEQRLLPGEARPGSHDQGARPFPTRSCTPRSSSSSCAASRNRAPRRQGAPVAFAVPADGGGRCRDGRGRGGGGASGERHGRGRGPRAFLHRRAGRQGPRLRQGSAKGRGRSQRALFRRQARPTSRSFPSTDARRGSTEVRLVADPRPATAGTEAGCCNSVESSRRTKGADDDQDLCALASPWRSAWPRWPTASSCWRRRKPGTSRSLVSRPQGRSTSTSSATSA